MILKTWTFKLWCSSSNMCKNKNVLEHKISWWRNKIIYRCLWSVEEKYGEASLITWTGGTNNIRSKEICVIIFSISHLIYHLKCLLFNMFLKTAICYWIFGIYGIFILNDFMKQMKRTMLLWKNSLIIFDSQIMKKV